MTEVVSVRFRGRGKAYYFDPNGITAAPGDLLVVETSKGLELGTCQQGNHSVEDAAVVQPLRTVVRAATADDRRVAEINARREGEAFGIAQEKIAKHGLDMKLVDVECSFEGNKILFFFTADGRVDFRELVKDLAGVFRTRIELRQIGVRDEAKMLGGLGICGQPFCCSRFLTDFQPVSTKMAKTQSMSLNPAKISGACGRLMCCLRYEQDAYEDLVKHVPSNGTFVQTEDGYGNITAVNLLRQSVKVRLDGTGDPVFHTYPVEDIAVVPGGRPAEGEPLPDVLQPRPKKPAEPAAQEDEWSIPVLFAGMDGAEGEGEKPAAREASGERRSEHRHRRSRGRGGENRGAQPQGKSGEGNKGGQSAQREHQRSKSQGHGQSGAEGRGAQPQGKSGEGAKKSHRRRYGRGRGKGEGKSGESPS